MKLNAKYVVFSLIAVAQVFGPPPCTLYLEIIHAISCGEHLCALSQ